MSHSGRLSAMALYTVGHGTLEADAFTDLLRQASVELLVDVRSHPGSRRHPHFSRDAMQSWLPEAGVAYRWEPSLGGRRRSRPDSPNLALRHSGFRGYADHMASAEFAAALDGVLDESAVAVTTVMCAESLWWQCHRRLLADAALLTRDAEVLHLMHDGSLRPHAITEGARAAGPIVVYDAGTTPPLL